MGHSNTRGRNGRREQSQSRPSRRPFFASIFCLPRMPSVFNIIRFSVYTAVLIWTVICLAIAAHFQSILISSDLTRFVPFAIFVCSASLLLFLALLGFSLWKERNPISTRIELGCLGLAGVLWLALAAFVASSESEAAEVECFSSADASEPVDVPGFNTETYQAQYRVIEAFSFFNVILIWGFFILLLVLAIRQHRRGERRVWISSVTAFPWFNRAGKQNGGLPGPVTQRSKSRSRPVVTREKTQDSQWSMAKRQDSQRTMAYRQDSQRSMAKRQDSQHSQRRPLHLGHHSPTRNESPTYVYWIPHKTPDQAHVRDQRPRDRYHRDASPRR